MDNSNSIEVNNLKKKFTVRYTTVYGGLAKSGAKQVLDGISFTVKKGEIVGILGKNGSGKSTLLKIMAGIMDPDEGSLELKGRVASILELGMGFDPELSGRENIGVKCGLYGLTTQEIDACVDEIIEFSELGEQIDYPLRTYSSGMSAKLAFSILMHVKSDILIIDEVLSVGDVGFNSKCKMAFAQMKKRGKTIFLASHNIKILEDVCDKAIWIESGKIKNIGDPQEVCYRYEMNAINSVESVMTGASSGDVILLNKAGIMFRDGIGVEKDIKKAEEMFRKAASMGYIESQINLSYLLMKEGRCDEAKELLRKSSNNGNKEATMLLIQLENSEATDDDLINTVRALAEEGNTRAMKLLGDMLFNGIASLKDQSEAIIWYERCSQYNNKDALFQLGICYRDGIGVNNDAEKGVSYLVKSAECGNNKARIELANTYKKGMGVNKDINKSIYWYEQAAISGDSRSMYELATIYHDGIGVDIDMDKSNMWMRKYSLKTIANCELILGDLINQGYTGQRQNECAKWYLQSALKGNVQAILNMANMLYEGVLCKINIDEARKYFEIASLCNQSTAQYELALHMIKHLDEKNDNTKKAMDLMISSAKMNNRKAMIFLMNWKDNITDPSIICEIDKIIKVLDETGDLKARFYSQNT